MTYTEEEYQALREQAIAWRTQSERYHESMHEALQKLERLERDFVAAIEAALEAKRHV